MPLRKFIRMKPMGIAFSSSSRTPIGDRIERQAIAQLFSSTNNKILVSSTKGHTGHLLGGAGALESVFTLLACYHGVRPSTLNYRTADEDAQETSSVKIIGDDRPVPWQETSERIALKNSFGFGGTNACLILSNLF